MHALWQHQAQEQPAIAFRPVPEAAHAVLATKHEHTTVVIAKGTGAAIELEGEVWVPVFQADGHTGQGDAQYEPVWPAHGSVWGRPGLERD